MGGEFIEVLTTFLVDGGHGLLITVTNGTNLIVSFLDHLSIFNFFFFTTFQFE